MTNPRQLVILSHTDVPKIDEKWFDTTSVKIEDLNIDITNNPSSTIYNKLAKIADHDGTLKTITGKLKNYVLGEDMIIRLAPNNFDVVPKDIFPQLYNII